MKNALIVDDTKNIRKLLSTCLELKGYKVFEAGSGLEALKLVQGEAFDLAFIDIKMPEMNGTEVLRRIRNMGLSFPVFIMTAFPTIKNAVDCTKLGAVVYLQKPFSADKISSLIDTMDKFDETINEPSIEDYLKLAKEQLKSSRLDLAHNTLRKALSIDPSNGETYYLIGRVEEMKGNMEEANRFYAAARGFGYSINH